MADPLTFPFYGVDIETDTSQDGSPTGPHPKGLDPAYAAITDVAVSGEGWSKVFTGEEHTLLVGLAELLDELEAGMLVTWNGAVFDLPFLNERLARCGLAADLRLVYDASIAVKYEPTPGYRGGYRASWGAHSHIDIAPLYKPEAEALGVKHSLKPVYRAVTGKEPIEVERSAMHLLSEEARLAYAVSDTDITWELASLLGRPELAAHADRLV